MAQSVQYLTNAQGEKVGVSLDLTSYTRLTEQPDRDENLLLGLSVEELEALADCKLAIAEQNYLDGLLAKNGEASLTTAEEAELDRLLAKADQLTVLKTRTRYTLMVIQGGSSAA